MRVCESEWYGDNLTLPYLDWIESYFNIIAISGCSISYSFTMEFLIRKISAWLKSNLLSPSVLRLPHYPRRHRTQSPILVKIKFNFSLSHTIHTRWWVGTENPLFLSMAPGKCLAISAKATRSILPTTGMGVHLTLIFWEPAQSSKWYMGDLHRP